MLSGQRFRSKLRAGAYREMCMEMVNNTVRWTISVSEETDITVRSYLAQRGMKEGDLSRFIEEAVKSHVFDQTLAEVRSKFSDLPADQLEELIDEAVTASQTKALGS